MKRFVIPLLTALAVVSSALARDYVQGDMHIMKAWSRPLPPVSVNGAAYVTLMNMGDSPDKLVSASTPAAERAELHTHVMQDGVMKMRHVKAVDIAPGGQTVLQPGGMHIMLFGLKEPLVEGKSYPLTLGFERAGEIEVQVMIMEPDDSGSQMKHDEDKQGG